MLLSTVNVALWTSSGNCTWNRLDSLNNPHLSCYHCFVVPYSPPPPAVPSPLPHVPLYVTLLKLKLNPKSTWPQILTFVFTITPLARKAFSVLKQCLNRRLLNFSSSATIVFDYLKFSKTQYSTVRCLIPGLDFINYNDQSPQRCSKPTCL